MWLALFLACSSPEAPPPVAGPAIYLESSKVAAGAPLLFHVPAGMAMPEVEGVTWEKIATSDAGVEIWSARADAGSYVFPFEGPSPNTLYADVGVDGPSGGEMADLAAPPPPSPARWPYFFAAAAVAAALTVGAWRAWLRLRPAPPPPPPEAPAVVARREWARLRGREDLDAETLALELSAVYRRYLEATSTWSATSRTTREILDNLSGELTAAQLGAASRLLRAMDLVKFADRETERAFFDGLDADFQALVSR